MNASAVPAGASASALITLAVIAVGAMMCRLQRDPA